MNGNDSLNTAHAEVKAEIARTDSKVSLLLAFVGALVAGAGSVAKDMQPSVSVCVVGGLGMAVLVVAAGLLLRSARPNLRGRHGFPLWATLTAEEITTAVATDRAADIAGLSRIAVAKFTALRRAVDLTMTGGVLLAVALLLHVGGAA
ncbi:hypothetical protein DWB77_03618 [Streptomyces hundungensis]|uniref:Pycsar effector protein domain-containing protein n=1 Tax=Streptomyces hundungensis TaxID=1077946 RepID=A0A387HKZ5_9ACTN|nr:Pycsar system effector family protein [Streptomyces hundungensis]AYG81470.1 hypothetical protein DWB77_03618 [Streptomyces hundungensis]